MTTAGWYTDPDTPGLERWWDGGAWTTDVRGPSVVLPAAGGASPWAPVGPRPVHDGWDAPPTDTSPSLWAEPPPRFTSAPIEPMAPARPRVEAGTRFEGSSSLGRLVAPIPPAPPPRPPTAADLAILIPPVTVEPIGGPAGGSWHPPAAVAPAGGGPGRAGRSGTRPWLVILGFLLIAVGLVSVAVSRRHDPAAPTTAATSSSIVDPSGPSPSSPDATGSGAAPPSTGTTAPPPSLPPRAPVAQDVVSPSGRWSIRVPAGWQLVPQQAGQGQRWATGDGKASVTVRDSADYGGPVDPSSIAGAEVVLLHVAGADVRFLKQHVPNNPTLFAGLAGTTGVNLRVGVTVYAGDDLPVDVVDALDSIRYLPA